MRLFFFKRAYFRPDDYRPTIAAVDFDGLASLGIDVLFIDIDNTLVPYDESVPNAAVQALLDRLKTRGFRIVLISNNHEPRVRRFAEAAGFPAIADAKKPFSSGFRRAERLVGNPSRTRICVIGDQFMTDVYGGKRRGYRVVVVDAIKRKTERWYTRINRRLERMALAELRRREPEAFDRMHLGEKR